jgi:hypothetical protein
MPNYEPYHKIIERHEDNPAFLAWLAELKEEFHKAYPGTYLKLDENYCIQAYNSGMSAYQTLSEKHYD